MSLALVYIGYQIVLLSVCVGMLVHGYLRSQRKYSRAFNRRERAMT